MPSIFKKIKIKKILSGLKSKLRKTRVLLPHIHLLLPLTATVMTLFSTHILLASVINRSGDNLYHLLNEFAILNAIKAGDNPLGPLGMEFGQPLLRFYQALFYLYNVALHLLTTVDLKFWHNLTIIVCFALSPFSYYYFLKKLGMDKWTSATGGFLSMISVAAFGNSFEAYHQAGIVTQSMGGLFFPWFMGNYMGMLRGENRASGTAVLFALAFLSHAIMSVFAVFAGGLYYLVTPLSPSKYVKKLAIFIVLGVGLVAFWVFPFMEHTKTMRPIPDSIIRGHGVHWFNSVSLDELAMVLTSGRLLDDPPRKSNDRNANDKLMDKISIIGTLNTRPPVFTILTALGLLISVFRVRKPPIRFLVSGFFFSVMLFSGPDDFNWLNYLPFMKNIQTFRCTYLVEFFAFGLAAYGVVKIFEFFLNGLSYRQKFIRYPLIAAWLLAGGAIVGWTGTQIGIIGQTHLKIRPTRNFEEMIYACRTIPDSGYPFRVKPLYTGRYKLRQAWFATEGFNPYCTHWKGVGPSSAYHLCRSLGSPQTYRELYAWAGIRYISGQDKKTKQIQDAHDLDSYPLFTRKINSKGPRGKSFDWHYLFDSNYSHFLRPFAGKPLPVVCSDAQWIWISKNWILKNRNKISSTEAWLPLRIKPEQLEKSNLLARSETLLYLDDSNYQNDKEILKKISNNQKTIVSTADLEGIESKTAKYDKKLLDQIPNLTDRRRKRIDKQFFEEENNVFEKAFIKRQSTGKSSFQNFVFDVDLLEPMSLVLPMTAAPGWTATSNDNQIPVYSSGPDFVTVDLPRGAHRLVIKWIMPARHLIFLIITFLSVFFVLGLWIMRLFPTTFPKVKSI